MYRSLIVLTLSQCLAQCGPPMVILLGGIIGGQIAPAPNLATLPIALMIIGTASATVPAALFMGRFGRKKGFMSAACGAALAGLLASWAVTQNNFYVFCLATFMVGFNHAFVQQYRFAVAESVPEEKVPTALSILMLAGVVAAYIGPETAERMSNFVADATYAGSYLGLSALMLGALCLLSFYRDLPPTETDKQTAEVSLQSILSHPTFILAVGASAVGYGIMSLIMTATPVSMHSVDHFSLADTTWVIQSHIMAMFLPSLFSGVLIARLGPRKIIVMGMLLMFACIGIAAWDRHLMHYWWALVLLGIGWNFLFLGGTTLLTQTFTGPKRFKVQALNDFCVFTLQATAALGSGFLLSQFGWLWVLMLSLPWLFVLIIIMWMDRVRSPELAV